MKKTCLIFVCLLICLSAASCKKNDEASIIKKQNELRDQARKDAVKKEKEKIKEPNLYKEPKKVDSKDIEGAQIKKEDLASKVDMGKAQKIVGSLDEVKSVLQKDAKYSVYISEGNQYIDAYVGYQQGDLNAKDGQLKALDGYQYRIDKEKGKLYKIEAQTGKELVYDMDQKKFVKK